MGKTIKIIVLILLIFLTIIMGQIGYYLYITDFGSKSIFLYFISSEKPRNPRLEIPVTYNIGWWTNQNAFYIDSLKISIVESNLNLFNSESLISYNVFGNFKHESYWLCKIKEVHISERINLDTTLFYDRIIEITPIIENKDTKANGETTKFEFKNEHTITSNKWGINKIKFICGQKEQIIELHQSK